MLRHASRMQEETVSRNRASPFENGCTISLHVLRVHITYLAIDELEFRFPLRESFVAGENAGNAKREKDCPTDFD